MNFTEFMSQLDEMGTAPRPGGKMHDRSLEGYKTIGATLRQAIADLKMQTKGVMDSEAQQQLWPVVNEFAGQFAEFSKQIQAILLHYQSQGIGYRKDWPQP